MAIDDEYLYWANEEATAGGGGTIGRARLDGSDSDVAFVQTDAVLPCGVAVDGSHVYWANTAGGAIGRADSTAPGSRTGSSKGLAGPAASLSTGTSSTGATLARTWIRVGRRRLGVRGSTGRRWTQDWVAGMAGICGVAVDPD